MHQTLFSCCHCLFCFPLKRKRILLRPNCRRFHFSQVSLDFLAIVGQIPILFINCHCQNDNCRCINTLPLRSNKWKWNFTIKNRLVCKLSSLNCKSIIKPSNRIIILSNLLQSDVNKAKPTEISAIKATKKWLFQLLQLKCYDKIAIKYKF